MPTITKPSFAYVRYQLSRYGSVRRQLMQEYVQKSTSTTLPRSSCIVSGGELIQAVSPWRAGAWAYFFVGALLPLRLASLFFARPLPSTAFWSQPAYPGTFV